MKDIATAENIASQWVWLDELLDTFVGNQYETFNDAKAVLLLNAVYSIRPILIERNAVHTILKKANSKSSRRIEAIIQTKLGESADSFESQCMGDTLYTNIAFSLPALHSWLKTKELGFNVKQWDDWMQKTQPMLKRRELLVHGVQHGHDAINQNEQTTSQLTVSYNALQVVSGYRTPADVIAWLSSQNIPFATGARNRPFTTVDAINSALGVHDATTQLKRTITL